MYMVQILKNRMKKVNYFVRLICVIKQMVQSFITLVTVKHIVLNCEKIIFLSFATKD